MLVLLKNLTRFHTVSKLFWSGNHILMVGVSEFVSTQSTIVLHDVEEGKKARLVAVSVLTIIALGTWIKKNGYGWITQEVIKLI